MFHVPLGLTSRWLIGDTFKREASEASYAGLEAGHRHFRDEWSFSACGFETGDDGYPCLSLTCQRKESFTDSKAHFSAHSQYVGLTCVVQKQRTNKIHPAGVF